MEENYGNNDTERLSNNGLAFIALVNEYCSAVENVAESDEDQFVDAMVRLLPRLYISANDLPVETFGPSGFEIGQTLREDEYNSLRDAMARVFGEDDTYLEVFEEDMKYSDTPIGASIAEGLADLYQVFFDFLEAVRESPVELINEALVSVRESFGEYWSQTLTNVLRAVNAIKYR